MEKIRNREKWKDRQSGKPELQMKVLYVPHHILIKLLFQQASEMYVMYEIGLDPVQETQQFKLFL